MESGRDREPGRHEIAAGRRSAAADCRDLQRAMLAETGRSARARGLIGRSRLCGVSAIARAGARLVAEGSPDDEPLWRLACRLGDAEAQQRAVERSLDAEVDGRDARRRDARPGRRRRRAALARLAPILTARRAGHDQVRGACARFRAATTRRWPKRSWRRIRRSAPRSAAKRETRCSRNEPGPPSISAQIDSWTGRPARSRGRAVAPGGHARRPELDALVRKHWGVVRSATPEDRLAVVRRLNNDLRGASGDAAARPGAVQKALRHVPHAAGRRRKDRARPDARQSPRSRLSAGQPGRSRRRSFARSTPASPCRRPTAAW